MRTAVLGSRFSSPLAPFACTSSTSFYNPASIKQQARLSSFVPARVNRIAARPQTLCRPQTKVSLSPILRNTSIRSNSTESAAFRNGDAPLDWNSFFKLRASRRRYTLGSSIATSVVTTTLGVQFIATQDLESLGVQVMGLDPFVVLGLATAACGAAGWLMGPFVGNAVWGLIYRNYRTSVNIVSLCPREIPANWISAYTVISQKEKEFFNRIKKYRVDPSSNSIANPVPDYYGEKIGSVQGYRQWLKDQRAFNRKRRNFIA